MNEDSFLFKKIHQLPQTHIVTCQPWQNIHAVAAAIREGKSSGAVVCDHKIPIGVITDRDFRNLVAERRESLEELKAEDIMTSPIVKIDKDDYVFEAIYLMASNNIHRLVLTDNDGFFAGAITADDITTVHTSTPVYFNREVEGCKSIEALKKVNEGVLNIVNFSVDAGAKTRDIIRLISHFNDSITHRAIALIEQEKGIAIPDGVTFLVLGSEGREEQTLRTDQDNAMVFRDDLDEESKEKAARFAEELIETLAYLGVPKCPGNTMASNPEWRKTESEWVNIVDQCIDTPTPENLLIFGMFQDFRALHGDMELEERLRKGIIQKASTSALFMARLAKNVSRFTPPLGWFDRFILEKSGEHKGKINLKKAGIFTITEGANLLAMETDHWHGTTWDKLEKMEEIGVLDTESTEELLISFNFLVRLRLTNQLKLIDAGKPPNDYVDPNTLRPIEQARLRDAFHGVKKLIRILRDRYQVDLITN